MVYNTNTKLNLNDLDIIFESTDYIIVAGKLNANHALWNSRTPNSVDNLLYSPNTNSQYGGTRP